MNADLHSLIQGRLSGTLTEDEESALQAALASDAEARRLYLDYMNLDVALASKAASDDATRELITSPATPAASRWLQWRPIAAAAAGLVLGLFGASLVYGFAAQRQAKTQIPQVKTQILLMENFEDVAMPRDRGFPKRVDVWSGDVQAPQGDAAGVLPAEGQHMVALSPVEKRKFSYASRFMDVSALAASGPTQSRQIEVTARFHGASPGAQDRFQIRLAAFAEDLAGARATWFGGYLDEQALVHVAKTVKPHPDGQGWTMVRSTIDLPAGAKYLLISLAAGVDGDEATKTAHYLDDVQVRLIARDAVP
jgi:hypothetical protein